VSGKSIDVLGTLIQKCLSVPGARVDREKFLRENLSLYTPAEVVENAIEENPSKAGIPTHLIDELAKHSIKFHIKTATACSAASGLPGGLWMAGTIPADTMQFYANVIILSQKLAYLYGWPDLDDKNDIDQLKNMVILFLGVMMGISQFNKLVAEVSKRLAIEIVKRVPRKALTKTLWYPLIKSAAKWIGVKITKDIAAKGIAKVVPLLGAITSGTFAYLTMKHMAKKLQNELKASPLANMKDADPLINNDENAPIEVDFKEVDM